jgi:hypothetical protein
VESLVGKVFVCGWGSGMRNNTFYVVERETPTTVVVREVGSRRVSGDHLQGEEVADLDAAVRKPDVRRIRKGVDAETGAPRFWHRQWQSWLHPYDGTPRRFDYID